MGGSTIARTLAPLLKPFNPRCLAMCGVCAGHPDDTDLGDVVLADRVFQHDEGKHKPNGFQGDLWVHATIDRWRHEAQDLAGPARSLHGYAEPPPEEARWWFLEKLLTTQDPFNSNAMRRFVPDDQRAKFIEALEQDALVTFGEDAYALTDIGPAGTGRPRRQPTSARTAGERGQADAGAAALGDRGGGGGAAARLRGGRVHGGQADEPPSAPPADLPAAPKVWSGVGDVLANHFKILAPISSGTATVYRCDLRFVRRL